MKSSKSSNKISFPSFFCFEGILLRYSQFRVYVEKQIKLYAKLEKHFKYLDECNLQESKILKSSADKECYESYIMFAFRKFQSLTYHLNNTITLLNKETESLAEEADRLAELKGLKLIKITKFSTKLKKDSYELVYELFATARKNPRNKLRG